MRTKDPNSLVSFDFRQRTYLQCSVSYEKNRCGRWLSTIGERVGVLGRPHKDYSVLRLPSIKDHTGFVLTSPAVSDLVVGEHQSICRRGCRQARDNHGLKERQVREGTMVVVNMHNGGYIFGTAHPKDGTANVPKGLVSYGKKTGTIKSQVPSLCLPPIQAQGSIPYCPPLDTPTFFPQASSRIIFSLFFSGDSLP